MCGILGVFRKDSSPLDINACARLQQLLVHRGPDDQGTYLNSNRQLLLGHTRLAIIDLSGAGHQPMAADGGNIQLVFNGEIYNYGELQQTLKTEGRVFTSNSDTEVILQGYLTWGLDGLLQRLRGMYAFALYDARLGALFLARDRFGIKPLYYYEDDQQLVFASEVRALMNSGLIPCARSRKADIAFLLFGYVPEPLTTIQNLHSLPAGAYLSVEANNSKLARYYQLLDIFRRPKKYNLAEIQSELASLLADTVQLHLISDAPLGVFLSGGIDSSALVAIASRLLDKPVTTVSIVFDEQEYSELPYQRLVAQSFKSDHREIKVTSTDFCEEIDHLLAATDQPTIDGINTYFVSRAARRAGLKAVLSGAGADELFCGYSLFTRAPGIWGLRWLPAILRTPLAMAKLLPSKWRRLSYLEGDNPLNSYLAMRSLFAPIDAARILGIAESEVSEALTDFEQLAGLSPELAELDAVDWFSYMEISYYLKDQLLKDTDVMSMCHGLETRVPFLDHLLIEYVASTASRLRLNQHAPKPLLVNALYGFLHENAGANGRLPQVTAETAPALRELFPSEVIFRKKRGFVFPLNKWLRNFGGELLKKAVANGALDIEPAEQLWHGFELGQVHWSRIWALVTLGSWGLGAR